MIGKLLGVFNKSPAQPFNDIYELLFCDRPELYRPQRGVPPTEFQQVLYERGDAAAVAALAADSAQESRVRLLAYRWLAAHGQPPTSREILGVVIEVGLAQGNDTLAAYADGSVRYINQSGKLAVFDGGPPPVVEQARRLVAVSRTTVDRIGPWDQPRRPPPKRDEIRLSFLVADGLYFGEGPFALLAREPIAQPVIHEGQLLLRLCVDAALEKR